MQIRLCLQNIACHLFEPDRIIDEKLFQTSKQYKKNLTLDVVLRMGGKSIVVDRKKREPLAGITPNSSNDVNMYRHVHTV